MLTAGDIFHHQQPELTSLLWHNCLRLSHDQVQNLVAKFPVLEYLLFYYEAQTPPLADTVTSDTAGLATLTQASKLRAVSLQEVSDDMLNIFETHFVLKQKFGNAGRAQKRAGTVYARLRRRSAFQGLADTCIPYRCSL